MNPGLLVIGMLALPKAVPEVRRHVREHLGSPCPDVLARTTSAAGASGCWTRWRCAEALSWGVAARRSDTRYDPAKFEVPLAGPHGQSDACASSKPQGEDIA
ncbi:hypothetical protein GCM10010415_14660 [Streptomyces atrovirens]